MPRSEHVLLANSLSQKGDKKKLAPSDQSRVVAAVLKGASRSAASLKEPKASATVDGAKLFQLPGCEEALAHTHAIWRFPHKSVPQVSWSPEAKLAYLKTAKAGSVSMKTYMDQQFNDTSLAFWSEKNPPAGTFTFTFVRDPLERALAAYAEVDGQKRTKDTASLVQAHVHKVGTTYVAVPRKAGNGTARFLAYLDDLVADRVPAEWKPSHSHLVTYHLLTAEVASRVNFVGKLENLPADWPDMLERAGVPVAQRTAQPPNNHVGKSAYLQEEAVPRTDEVVRKVCEVYAADYACLGYEKPEACRAAQ